MGQFGPYRINALWGGRVETPAAIAERFLLMMDAIGKLDPQLTTWRWSDCQEIYDTEGACEGYLIADIRDRMDNAVERNLGSDGEEPPDPYYGYWVFALAEGFRQERVVGISGKAGAPPKGGASVYAWTNQMEFYIGPQPEPTLMNYELWRDILLILAETWEATFVQAQDDDLRPFWKGSFPCAWMSYVSPRFATLVTPPEDVIVEHRPNGGLFLAAADVMFQTINPDHMRASRAIEMALQPLERLPLPIDDLYR